MAARPTRNIVQRPFNPELPPVINLNSQASLKEPDNTNDCGREGMEFLTEKFVDFESLKLNGFAVEEEVRKLVAEDKSLRGKTRVQMGLRPFKGKEIGSNLLGIDVLITQEHIAKILGLDNEGEKINLYKGSSKYADSIK
ncbi:hypothetical protein P8452_65976 [Trifolium repens]|nr:hypothetical protein P8452_65976 [Trifolium repens]